MPKETSKYSKKDLEFRDDGTLVACKQLKASDDFKQPRMREILETEDILAFKLKPALLGRLNVPFDGVVMNGFIDTLLAQSNKNHRLEFIDPKGNNLKGARKITAAYEYDSSSSKGKWKQKWRWAKYNAAVSGRGIFQYYAESDPVYTSHLEVIDHYDFHCEPNGGGHLDTHMFKGRTNIFRTDKQIREAATSGWYDKEQVAKLIAAYQDKDYKYNDDLYRNKAHRLAGLDAESNAYVGQTVYNITEWVMMYEGDEWHVIFDYKSGIWLRFVKLEEDFESKLSPFVSFSTEDQPFVFWHKAPADKVKPVAEAIRINLNEVLNNNRKRNWDMKAVDKNMFTDLSQLDYRQDGIAIADVKPGQSIQNGIYRFETPEISGALNLNEYLDNFVGINAGINKQTKGQASEDRVGIAEINEISISKRIKLLNDSFLDCLAELGLRYDWGVYEHMPEDMMVKMIGVNGVEWEKITKQDTEPDYDVRVVVDEDIAETEAKKAKKSDFLKAILQVPAIVAQYNPKVLAEELALGAGFDPERVKRLMDTKNEATDEIISEANMAIEMILNGKEPKVNRSATTGFLKRLHNYMMDNELDPEIYNKLQAYFDLHIPIVEKNHERMMMTELENEIGSPEQPKAPQQEVPPNQ